ncbi:MAG TPA: nucleotide sugar dehydrogenase [Anaerolineales bacterium]|nr:nucleotide sugar dehydrogenase [Anaerolineales bacterium]
MSYRAQLLEKINNRTARVAIAGMGYVGLPLAVEFARQGFSVVGIDPSQSKMQMLNHAQTYIEDIANEELAPIIANGALRGTTEYSEIANCDALIICVPTPLRKTRDPDMSYVISATESAAQYVHPGLLVVLESTTYPGTTEEIVIPHMTRNGLVLGSDIFVAFSPERIDPANKQFGVHNTPKVIGGATEACGEVACALYGTAVGKVVPVSSTQAAEMVKLLENTFRAVNIGLVNEFAIMCEKLNVNVWEVIEAAKTKPFGFMPFYPGPGLGGHCIPIDPLYLSWRLKSFNYNARFIELADDVNTHMPGYVVSLVGDALNEVEKSIRNSKVLVLGVAYKRDVSDVRESPALDVIEQLEERGAHVTYNDPYVPYLGIDGFDMHSVELSAETLGNADCVLLITDHSNYDWQDILSKAKLVVDTRNATKNKAGSARIVKL